MPRLTASGTNWARREARRNTRRIGPPSNARHTTLVSARPRFHPMDVAMLNKTKCHRFVSGDACGSKDSWVLVPRLKGQKAKSISHP